MSTRVIQRKAAVRRASAKSPAVMKHADHARLWRMIEGGVVSAFHDHPEYLTETGKRNAVQSVTKRVIGNLVGHAKELRKQASLGMRSPTSAVTTEGPLTRANGSDARLTAQSQAEGFATGPSALTIDEAAE